MSRILLVAAVASVLLVSAGCVGVYSRQDYGPNLMQQSAAFTIGSPIASAFSTVGAPDATFQSGKQTVYVFKRIEGFQVLSLFGQVKKTELMVITEEGLIKEVKSVPKGEGLVILAPVLTPATEIE
ncbi:MAG: hypothetical protein JXP34_18775 [Planctomycetes bacterium]|nr:hypothetical protein [Planctomycetota bacterium]